MQLKPRRITPPPPNTSKINWDVAVDKLTCKMGIRVIVRDENRKVAATMKPSRDYLYHDAVVAESVAAPKAQFYVMN